MELPQHMHGRMHKHVVFMGTIFAPITDLHSLFNKLLDYLFNLPSILHILSLEYNLLSVSFLNVNYNMCVSVC